MAAKKSTTRSRRSRPRKKGGLKLNLKTGALRKQTKTKAGQNIPVSKLEQMKRSKNPLTRKRATFALNARKWRKVGGRRKKK